MNKRQLRRRTLRDNLKTRRDSSRKLHHETLERRELLAAELMDVAFAPGTPQADIDRWYQQRALDTAGQGQQAANLGTADARWRTSASGASPDIGDAATITWSIVPDGTSVTGLATNETSDLIAFLDGIYGNGGATATDPVESRPWFGLIQQSFDAWENVSGIDFVYEPNDDGAAQGGSGPGLLGTRGDIRIGGGDNSANPTNLAFAQLPVNGGNFGLDGDMVVNTSSGFYAANSDGPTGLNLGLRNTLAHEIGHAVGISHVIPDQTGTALMEPTVPLSIDGPQHDDILGAQTLYGDVNGDNDIQTHATPIGTLSSSIASVSGVSIDNETDVDWYSFEATAGQFFGMSLTPDGEVYDIGPQNGVVSTVDSRRNSDLRFDVFDPLGNLVTSQSSQTLGATEAAFAVPLSASGTYTVSVSGASPLGPATGTVTPTQLYTLSLSEEIFTGPQLIAIRPDADGLLNDGDTLNVAPSEFNLFFKGGAGLDESTINSDTIKLVRSGGDGVFGNSDDVEVSLGFVGLNNPGSTDPTDLAHIVLRPASSAGFNSKSDTNQFPDDFYQIQIIGDGASTLSNLAGEAVNNGNNLITNFHLDRGALVVSVVPQPVTRSGNTLSQDNKVIEVYFDNQELEQADAENVNFYRLYDADTKSPAAESTPSSVVYDAANNKATLTFTNDIPEGSFRLDIGQAVDSDPLVNDRGNLGVNDISVSFDTAIPLGTVNAGALADTSIRLAGRIEPQTSIALPPLPGGEDDPGHREIQREQHVASTGTTPTIPTAIRTVQYHFPLVLGEFVSGDPNNPGQYLNLITETEKQIVRDIFEIYAKESGFEFIESTNEIGLSIGKGDLRALDSDIGPNDGVAGLGGPGRVVLNGTGFNQSNRFYGDGFTGVMFHEIGHALSLSHAYDQPAVQGQGPIANEVLPGDNDILHLQRISAPNSTDIDVYSFSLPTAGRLSAEIFAERLTLADDLKEPSLLNSALSLYRFDTTTGDRVLVARNDQYFGADAFLDIELESGTYFIGVSSAGNTAYDLNVPNSGFGGTTDGEYELALNFKPDAVAELRDTRGTALDGDADGTPGGVHQFWFQSTAPGNTIFVDKLADTLQAPGQGLGTLASPFESISQGLEAAAARVGTSITSPTIVRIVGNGGLDGDVSTLADNRAYLVGTAIGGATLPDGAEFRVPAGVTVMLDAGTLIKMRKANIDAGSTAAGINRAGGSIQVLGTPTHSVFLRSYHDDTAGGNSDGGITTPDAGDFGGIVFRDDSDREANGIFLNHVNHADIKHGGGKVFVDSNELTFTSIHITNARPTLSYNLISEGATSAISASPDSFDDSLRRIGPDIQGNYLVGNSINGLAIRIDTPSGSGLTKLQVSGRFDDTDITHVLSENLIIAGGSGGAIVDGSGNLVARPAGRLQIDPGVVIKLNRSRIEVERGAGTLIAEGTVGRPVVFTAQDDKRYGGSGSFDTNQSPNSVAQPAAWGGLYFGEGTSGSIDQAIITFGGGNTGIEGSDFPFNALEIHQSDVRVVNSLFQDNAATSAVSDSRRNGRGSNGVSTIYVRGAQPVLINNTIKNNEGTPISINANSMLAEIQRDYGRATGPAEPFTLFDDNYGPLIRLNSLENNGGSNGAVNGMLVRGEEVTVESVWDDTDMVHVLQNEVSVDNLHTLGGLTLQSSNSESLVIKLSGADAGFTATGTPAEIIDRIGGTIHVLGTVGHPVIFTSVNDDSVGAGFTPSGIVNRNTNNSVGTTTGTPGDWRGLVFDEYSNDRNVAIVRELENPLTNRQNVNGTPTQAQNIGVLAPNIASAATPTPAQKSGDDNRRLGFEIHGFISPDDGSDTDVYSFTGTNGTPIWIDIDRTDSTHDLVIELIDATSGISLVSSSGPDQFGGVGAATLTQNILRGGDYYSQNYRDPGFYYVLNQPNAAIGTEGTFFIRVSSKTAAAGNEQSRGKYQLQIRTQQLDEFPGSTVRFSDIRFADTGIDVRGLPAHSPLIAEAGEVLAANGSDVNDSFANASTLVNLLETDAAAIGLSGALGSETDVDWYQFDLDQTGVQVIGGVNDGAGAIAVVLDIDYADGAVSADTTVAVYDQNQRLVYIGRESDITDDQRPDGVLSVNDLTRGSLAKKDSYIGPIHLTPGLGGQTYYVAVMSNRQQPSALNGIFQSSVSNATAQTRLEPVNSVTRIVEDHLGLVGYNSNGVTISPTTGALFDVTNPNTEIQGLTLGDVGLYVATDVAGNTGQAGANDSLYTYNPFTGGTYVTRVSTNISTGGSGFDDVQDIVVRSDGRMFGYQRQIPNQPLNQPNFSVPDRVGQLVEIDPATGQVIAGSQSNDNIAGPVIGTAGLTVPNTATLADNIGTHLERADEFTLSDEVDAFTFERRDQGGPADAPVPIYDTYFSVRESDIASRLYRGDGDGNAAPVNAGANPDYGVIGDIQPAGVTFATQTFEAIQPVPMAPPNISEIRIKSRDAGSVGNFRLEFATRPNNLNMVVGANIDFDANTGVSTRVITLTIGAVLNNMGMITNAPSAAAITHAINSHPTAKTWVTAIIAGGNQNAPFGDGADGIPAIGFTPSATTTVVGSDGFDPYGPLRGRVTGLSFGGYDGSGNHTGPLYGVTTAGELITIDPDTAEVTNILESGDAFGVENLDFQGLSLGPQSVEGGRYRNTLFAVTGDGEIVAFNTATQLSDPVFDTDVVTQTITVAGGTPNVGYFTITSDAGTGADPRARFTTVPIADDAPATLTVNESQILDTTGYSSVTSGLQSTFTLSLVDDQGAITSLSANNTNNNNPVNVISATDTIIPVESVAGFPAPGVTGTPFVIQIDNEQMRVTTVGSNSLTVDRGWNGTTAVSHDDTATVFEIVKTELAVPASIPSNGSTLSASIDDQNTSTVVPVANASPFSIGDIIRIGDEEMIVNGVSLIPSQLTVSRGVGGTTSTHHNPTSVAPSSTPTAVTIVSDTLSVQDALPFALADRLRIGNEDMRILSFNTGFNTVRVVRGVNGTALGAHAAGTATFKLDTTAPIDINATLTTVQAAIEALPSVGSGNVLVEGGRLSGDAFDTDDVLTTADLTRNPETITFLGDLKGKDLQPLTTDTTNLVGDEIQTISLDTNINHGNFRLDFYPSTGGVQTTADIPFDASASQVQQALESLSSIGVGNVVVTGSQLPGGPLSVQFVNELGDQDVNQLVVDRGALNDFEVHTITLAGTPISGDYRLSINDAANGIFGTTNPISFDATAAQVQTAIINGVPALNNTNVVVTGGPSPTTPFSVQFIGNLAGNHVTPFRLAEDDNTLAPLTDNGVSFDVRAVAPNTVQKLELSNITSFGSFQLTLSDPNLGTGTTANLQYNATATQVQNALQGALPQLAGNLNVTGGPVHTTPILIEFTNELAGLPVAQIQVVGAPAFTPAATLSTSMDQFAIVSARNEIQSIELTGTPTGGTFRLTLNDPANGFFNAQSDLIDFNADAAAIQAALISGIPDLATGGANNIFVEGGPVDSAPIRIEFIRGLSRVEIAEFTVEFVDNLLLPPTQNTVEIVEVQAAANPLSINEIQQIVLTGANATAGQFTLSLEVPAEQGATLNARVVKTSSVINYNDNAVQIVNKIVAGIPELAGQILVTGGPLSQANTNGPAITIEFINDYAGFDVSLFDLAITTAVAPGGASIDLSTPRNSVPQTPTIGTTRDGIEVFAPITEENDGVLSVFDALDALPNLGVNGAGVSNIRVSGDLQNPGSTVSFADNLATVDVNDFNINNFLMQNVPPFVSDVPAPYNGTNTTIAFLSNTSSISDGFADSPIMTIDGYESGPNQGNQRPIGLAFSPFDFNLWHPTTRRGNDAGHGINFADDLSRSPGNPDVVISLDGVSDDRRFKESAGGVSLYFGLEPWLRNELVGSESYLTYTDGVNAQLGIASTAIHQDLSSNPAIVTGVGETGTGSYNLPGGAAGSIKSQSFDLTGSEATDRPTLYFNYYLETENHSGSTRNSDGNNPFRDSARVWASRDGKADDDPTKEWELLATNNSTLSADNVSDSPGTSELGSFLSHLSDAGLQSSNPRSTTQQIRQELFDNSSQWRQARVDLSTFAGEADVQLRFDFATSGAMNDPTLNSGASGNIDGTFGEFSDNERSIRGLANQFEGFYIDDIVVGFAERGEMVTGASGDSGITDLNASARTNNTDPFRGASILSGPYQLEIRRTGEYQNWRSTAQNTSVGVTYDTNDRHIIDLTEVATVDFESAGFPSNTPIDATQINGVPGFGGVIPVFTRTTTNPQTGAWSLEASNPYSAYQVTTTQLGGSATEAGVIEFTYSVDTSIDPDVDDGMYFLIDGVPQNLVAPDPDFPNSSDSLLAKGELSYRTVRFNLPSGPHTLTWVFDGTFGTGTAFIDNIVLLQGGTGLLADSNREREQGQFVIESNFITDSANRGINVQPGQEQGTLGGVSHPGSLINFPQTNADRLVPGIVITNNVVVGSGTGIRFAGETTSNPQRPVPFGRIVNNTLSGVSRSGTGVEIAGIASPTLMNNLFTDLGTSIVNNSTAVANSSEAPIIRSNFFQSNNNDPNLGTAFIDAGNTGSPFVDAANRNYYPVDGSAAIDSGQDNEQDRADYKTFKVELGIPESAIIAPTRDVYGQLRIDGSGSPSGGGSSVFIDRGAVDRSDEDAPFAVILNPLDDNAVDRDPNETIVHMTDSLLENFRILLGDGRGPNSPFEGTGVDGLTVNDPSDPNVSRRAVKIEQDGIQLEQGVDYELGYNELSGVLLLTPLSTLWEKSSVYKISLDNTQIADRAGNRLRPNQPDATTEFVIIIPEVDIDFGDAPASYGSLLDDNGARHAGINENTPRFGTYLDGEPDSAGVGTDDLPSVVTVDGNVQDTGSGPFAINNVAGTTTVVLSSMPSVGDNLQVGANGRSINYEFVLTGATASAGRVPVYYEATDTLAEITAALTTVMQSTLPAQNVQASVNQADSAVAELTIVGLDDEDGILIGQAIVDGIPVDGLFLDPEWNPGVDSPEEQILSYLNPLSADGAELVINTTGGGFLDLWIDFNDDGDFLDIDERVLTRSLVLDGENRILIATPAMPGVLPGGEGTSELTWARFRISPNGSPSHDGLVVGGEVEDYQVRVAAARTPEPGIGGDQFGFAEGLLEDTAFTVDGLVSTIDGTVAIGDNDEFNGAENTSFVLEDDVSNGTLVFGDDGSIDYTPDPEFYGFDYFTYRIEGTQKVDVNGTIVDLPVRSSRVGTVTLTVNAVNDPPTAENKDDSTTITTEPTDTNTSTALTFTADQLLQGATPHADVAALGNTSTIRNPYNESEQILKVIQIAVLDATGTSTPVIAAANMADPLTPNNGTYTATTHINGTAGYVPAGTVTVTAFDGKVTMVVYQPNDDYNDSNPFAAGGALSSDQFVYTVADDGRSSLPDGSLASPQPAPKTVDAMVTLHVRPQNDSPTAVADSIDSVTFVGRPLLEDVEFAIPRSFLLANDFAGVTTTDDESTGINDGFLSIVTDAGTDPLFPTDFQAYPLTTAQGGTVTIDPISGDLIYKSAQDYYGPDSFEYFIVDQGVSISADGTSVVQPKYHSATVSLVVDPVNDAPSAADKSYTVTEDIRTPLVITNADLIVGATGHAAPALGAPFDESIQDAPNTNVTEVVIGGVAVNAANVSTFTLPLPTSTDPANPRGYVTAISFTAGGILDQLEYLPAENYNSDNPLVAGVRSFDSLTFYVTDDDNAVLPQGGNAIVTPEKSTVPATVTINVTPQNDAPVPDDDIVATGNANWTAFSSDNPTEDQAITIPLAFLLDGDTNGPAVAPINTQGLGLPANDELDLTNDVSPLVLDSFDLVTAEGGTVELLPSGDLLYTPPANVFGLDTFVYTVIDAGINEDVSGNRVVTPLTSPATISILLDPVNDPPTSENRFFDDTTNSEDDVIAFSKDDLLFNAFTPPAVASDADPAPVSPFNEDDQDLHIVVITVAGETIDAGTPANHAELDVSGTGQIVRSIGASGSEFEFNFTDGKFTNGFFRPGPDYNSRTPFAPIESFTFVIEDDDNGSTFVPGSTQIYSPAPAPTYDLPALRSTPVTVNFALAAVNDEPTFQNAQRTINFLEDDFNSEIVVTPWATDIYPGNVTSLDEDQRESVLFTFAPGMSVIDAGLFRLDPIINVDPISREATLLLYPSPDAVGTATVVMEVRDVDNVTPGFVPQVRFETFTVNVQPVNDAPVVDLTTVTTSADDGQSPPDEAYSVLSDGRITYTLKEDNTTTNGNTSPYYIPLRQDGSATGYSPIGLLDVFRVGPSNEADGTVGGSQTLQLSSFPTQTVQGGSLTPVFDGTGELIGLNYLPPVDDNNRVGQDDTFIYAATDTNTAGQTYNLQTGLLEQDPLTVFNQVRFNLLPVNDAPVFGVSTTEVDATEDSGLQTINGYALNIAPARSTATDETSTTIGQTTSFQLTPTNFTAPISSLFSVAPSIDATSGALTFQSAPDVFGAYTFDVVLIDSGADDNARGDINRSVVRSLTIDIAPVNDLPTAGNRTFESNTYVEDVDISFTKDQLLNGFSPIAVPSDSTPVPIAPFDETDQNLKIVAFATGSESIDAGRPENHSELDANGTGTITLSSGSFGGTFEFSFANGDFTSGVYRPGPDYNGRTPFASAEVFSFVIEDEDNANTAAPGTTQVYDLPAARSEPVTVEFKLKSVNDPVTFENALSVVNVLENDNNLPVIVRPWATEVYPGNRTSLDELQRETVVFTYLPSQSTVPAGLFRLPPEISVNPTTRQASLTVHPSPDVIGTATIVMQVQDADTVTPGFVPETQLVTLTVNVRPVNDAPVIDLGNINTSDDDGNSPVNEAYSVASNGTITYTLKEDNTSSGGVTSEYKIPLRSSGTGYQPIGLLDVFSVGPENESDGSEGGSQVLNLSNFPSQTSQGGSLELRADSNGDMALFYTPPTDDNNTIGLDDSFIYVVSDSNVDGQTYNPFNSQLEADPLTRSNEVRFNLLPVNDQPVFEVSTNEVRTAEDATIQNVAGFAFNIAAGSPTATDENSFANGQSKAFTLNLTNSSEPVSTFFSVAPRIDANTGVLTYQPAADVFGKFVFNVVLDDDGTDDVVRGDIDKSITQILTIDVRPQNDAPVINAAAVGSLSFDTKEGETLVIAASGASVQGDLLGAFDAGPTNESADIAPAPGGNQSITLGSVPTTTVEGGTLTPLTDTNGNVTDYRYTPPIGFVGQDSFSYEIVDNGETVLIGSTGTPIPDAQTLVVNITIDVAAVNNGPTFTGGDDIVLEEDAGAISIPNWVTGLLPGPAGAADEIANQQITSISIVKVGGDNVLVADPIAVRSGDALTLQFETAAEASGLAMYELILVDNGPNDPGNNDVNTTRHPFQVVVGIDNDPPTFTAGPNVTVVESSGPYTALWATNILPGPANESDQEVERFELTVPADKAVLFSSLPAIDPSTGILTFTPATFASGVIDVQVVAVDDLSERSVPPVTLQITITPVNDVPTPFDDNISTDEDTVLQIEPSDLLANDTDPDTPFDPSETIVITSTLAATSTLGAALSFDNSGNIIYDPTNSVALQAMSPTDSLQDEFVYFVTNPDAPGSPAEQPATVTLTVQGLNDRPDVQPDSASVFPGQSVEIDVVGQPGDPGQDTDRDGEIDRNSIIVTLQPANGSVRLNPSGTLTYTAQEGFTGSDTFSYTVADNLGQQSVPTKVTINVSDFPFANPDVGGNVDAEAGESFVLDVLSNDRGDLDLSSILIDTSPQNGTVDVQADGTLLYTPSERFNGQDTFSYTVADNQGRRSAPGFVTVPNVASGRQNPANFSDVNADGDVTPDDALRVINKLARDGRDSNGIVLPNGIPIAAGDMGPDYWDANGSQSITPADILYVLIQLAENAANDPNAEFVQPSGEFVPTDRIDVGTNLNRNGDTFEPAMSVEDSTDKVVGASTLEPAIDTEWIDLIAEEEESTDDDVSAIDAALSNLF
ncbi:tandem-95 repeat protein [Planctomycetes bacterium K23_9]|uniref:Matrixin n=1 Tax=Stieleria marina TaxID=1930275 RepID=A0A517NRD4_9BACT|nr:Matrixin [Planctomycetes bacterium K23_9]